MPNRKQPDWTISDLVDLEYFFVQDDQLEEMSVSRRDRELYLTHLEDHDQERSVLIRRWLELRREDHRSGQVSPLPGKSISLILYIFTFVLFFFGGLAGISLSWVVIKGSYVNVFFALLVLVVLPFFFTLVMAVFLPAYRLVVRGRPVGKGGEWFVGTLLPRLIRLIQKKVKGQKRALIDTVWGNLRARSSLYSGIMSWFVYRSFQFFGLGFSLGVLGTMVLFGLFTSMSFGWGTTIYLDGNHVYKIVSLIAKPWEIVGLNNIHPSLDQIMKSLDITSQNEYIRNEYIRNIWAKFFLLAIVIYTLLPRLMLLGIANLGTVRAYRRLSFNDDRCDALSRRMLTPLVNTGQEGDPTKPKGGGPPPPPPPPPILGRFQVLIPKELLKRPKAEHHQDEIHDEFKTYPDEVYNVTLDVSEDAAVLTALSKDSNESTVVILFESWQPCIKSTLNYLRTLRRGLGNDRQLIVCLIGREDPQHWATPNTEKDFDNWRRCLANLGDPHLRLHRWGKIYE